MRGKAALWMRRLAFAFSNEACLASLYAEPENQDGRNSKPVYGLKTPIE
jgi:hypothetical protein